MKSISIPYGKSKLDLHIREENLKAVLYPRLHEYKSDRDEESIVQDALRKPIGPATLSSLAYGKRRVTLVTSDHTRAVPSRITLPLLLKEIRKGNPSAEITILVATGLHRATSPEEMRRMFGDAVVDNERILVHNAFEERDMRKICTLPSGADFAVNHLAADCDLLVTEGFIEPHFFAGFSGGRKSILPGICSETTIKENHSYLAIAHKNAIAGVTGGNPIHEDMVYAAQKVNVQFTLNVALDGDKRIIAAFAGDLVLSHEQGCAFVGSLSKIPRVTGDIIVTGNGGYPLDQNLYQTPKAAATAEACSEDSSAIIMCAACEDGIGGMYFEKIMLSGSAGQIEKSLSAISPKETIPEMWCAQVYARILKRHKLILVTSRLDPDIVRKMNMIPASSPDEALEIAYRLKGEQARVVVIPDGVASLVSGE